MAKRRQRIKAAGYLRRSDKDQKGSIENQKKTILDYLKRYPKYQIVEWYIDDGISGDATEDRAAFLKMQADAGTGAFSVVLCRNQDRFGRFDLLDAGYWIKPFRDAGVSLVTADDGPIDWEDFTGRMMYALKQEGKHQYLRDLSKAVTDGQMKAAENGSWCGAAPRGYVIVGEKLNKRLVLGNSDDVELVKRIFEEYVNQNRSMAEIARRLNDEGIKSSTGKKWRHDGVKFILENAAYTGRFIFNKNSYSKYHHFTDGEVRKGGRRGPNPESDWIVHDDHHEAIIDVATFNKAQTKLAQGKRGVVKEVAADYLFGGKLFCGRCGAPLWGIKNGNKKAGKIHLYYECSNRKRNGVDACDGSTVREDKLLEDILFTLEHRVMAQDWTDILKARIEAREELKPDDMPRGFDLLKKMFKAQQPKTKAKSIEKQLKAVEADLVKLERNQTWAKDEATFDRIGVEIERLAGKRDDLKEQLGDVLTDDDANSIVLSVLDKFSQLVVARYAKPVEADEEVRAAIRELDKIVIFTKLKNHGNGRRHTFRRGEIYLFGKNLNRKPKAIKRRTRANATDLNPHLTG